MIKDIIDDLQDFSFLKGLLNFGKCGNAIMSSVVDFAKVYMTKIDLL